MDISEFFDDVSALDRVDWPLMSSKYWNDTQQDCDRKRRRQAEFLVHRFAPWTCIKAVAVMNENTAEIARGVLENASYKPPLLIRPDWYY